MKTPLFVAGILLAGSVTAAAQTDNGYVSYIAASQTPVGALPPLLTNTLLNRLQNGGSLAIRYGYRSSDTFNPAMHAAAVTGILPVGLGSTVRITGGVARNDCGGCDAQLMLGVGGDYRLMGERSGQMASSSLITVSLDGSLGYGRFDGGSYVAGSVGVPVALVPRGAGMQFVPFLTPTFLFGQTSGGGNTSSGSHFAIGGGIGVYNLMSNVTVSAGGQYAVVDQAKSMVGIALIIGGK